MDNTVAIILASGSGRRFGGPLPKQYCDLCGRPLLMHTIDAFAEVIPRKNILVVIDGMMDDLWQRLCSGHGYVSPAIAFGGRTRTESLAKALDSLSGYDDGTVAMIHDGARPIASEALIRRMTHIPEGFAGAIPVVPVTDTLRLTDAAGGSEPVDRSRYVAVQTPQTFALGTLRKVYSAFDGRSATDDATMVQRATGGRIALIEGEATNIKVTNPLDIAVAETLMRCMMHNS